MKKIFLSMFALFGFAVIATAQTVTVADVEALPGETVTATLNLEAPVDTYTGAQITLQFPATGFSVGKDVATGWNGSINNSAIDANGQVKIAAGGNSTFTDAAIALEFTVDASLALDEYEVTVSGLFEGPDPNGGSDDILTPFSGVTFKVNVVNAHLVELDETATVAPAAASGVNVKVKRTINANEWSTICLPFAMDATQVKAAFGDDVQLGDFDGIESTTDAEDNITAINVKFNAATAIEANHPYIIKVTSPITEFTADAVNIDPQDASVDKDETKVKMGGKWYYFYNSFIGTYVAETPVPENNLFLSGNKFWYSKGLTKIKAFRAYFDFQDILSGVDNSSAPVFISFGSETTGIKNIQQTVGDDRYYNLNGQHVENPRKGQVYIKNNKKVVVK